MSNCQKIFVRCQIFFRETIGRLGQDLEKGEKGSFHQCLPRSEKSSNFPYPMFYVDNYSVMFFDVFLNAKKTSVQSLKITTKTDKTLAETIHTMGRHRAVSLPKLVHFQGFCSMGLRGQFQLRLSSQLAASLQSENTGQVQTQTQPQAGALNLWPHVIWYSLHLILKLLGGELLVLCRVSGQQSYSFKAHFGL